ncbi:MAG: deoxyribonuclease V [Acidobacteria bacterium]|nr:deoxyribonuclease V [Acidobacteriota bacterium]MBI3423971.1 deoxyribonuclease V [Acidobacteriota bacterium]
MANQPLHRWDLTPREAIALQQQLRTHIRLEPLSRAVQTIGGADVSFNKFSETIYAGIVVLSLPDLQIVDQAGLRTSSKFPYVPGLLSFREAPSLLEAWEQLRVKPDALMLDGQGLAHPRRLGIACHVGLWLDIPTLGCAKSILVGRHAEVPIEAGSQMPLVDRGELIGAALRTKRNVAPVFVSPGHLMDLSDAVALTLQATTKYRQPEPTRQAHLLVNRLRVADRE